MDKIINMNLNSFKERDNSQWVYDGMYGATWNWMEHNNLWTETNEETYWEQLGCVPPIRMDSNSFMVGEANSYDDAGYLEYSAFVCIGDRYFCKICSIKTYDLGVYKQEIRKQFEMEV